MFCCGKDLAGIFNTHCLVNRRVQHHQGALQLADMLLDRLSAQVFQKLLLYFEGATCQRNCGLSVALDFIQTGTKILYHMVRIRRRANGCNGFDFRNSACRAQHCRPAQRVADKDAGGLVILPQKIRCAHQIADVGRKIGVGKITIRRPKAGKIEAQNRDATGGQFAGNPFGGQNVFRAGKAMGKDRRGADQARRHVHARSKRLALAAGKGDFLNSGHGRPFLPWKTCKMRPVRSRINCRQIKSS